MEKWTQMLAHGVTGRVEDVAAGFAELYLQAVRGMDVRRYDLRRFHAEPAGLNIHHSEKWQVGLVHHNGCAGQSPQLCGARNVVYVCVGNDDLLTRRLFCTRKSWMVEMSSPGSTTMASRVCSSPRIEQLQAMGPTAKDLMNHEGEKLRRRLSAIFGRWPGS